MKHSFKLQKGQEEREERQHMRQTKESSPQRLLRSVFSCFLRWDPRTLSSRGVFL